ncbi:MAG TPA: SET domain-containing protein-lysine N-methyltransferase [Candidatus Binatia bacterium]|nr:SET domain-containing protein-lysine N-methyltransferase [Candidatus Binatia bacterium]
MFALKDIPVGATICFLSGKEVSLQVVGELEVEGSVKAGDTLQIGDETYIQLDEIYRCINHSCDPNAGIRGKNELFALKPISKGQEITYDYSTTMWEDKEQIRTLYNEELWEIPCGCGAKNCRKTIGEFYELPKKIQEKYVLLKAVPDYIAKKMMVAA